MGSLFTIGSSIHAIDLFNNYKTSLETDYEKIRIKKEDQTVAYSRDVRCNYEKANVINSPLFGDTVRDAIIKKANVINFPLFGDAVCSAVFAKHFLEFPAGTD